jgi:hypothetical protein
MPTFYQRPFAFGKYSVARLQFFVDHTCQATLFVVSSYVSVIVQDSSEKGFANFF